MSQVKRVLQKCQQCQQVTDGFFIPDGRFVCPNCFPPPVYERWRREWELIEKKRLKEQAAQERAEKRLQRNNALAAKLTKLFFSVKKRTTIIISSAIRLILLKWKWSISIVFTLAIITVIKVLGWNIEDIGVICFFILVAFLLIQLKRLFLPSSPDKNFEVEHRVMFVCTNCGYKGKPIFRDKGQSERILFFILGLFIWPLLIYWLWLCLKFQAVDDCPKCNTGKMVSIDTVLGKSIVAAAVKPKQPDSGDVKRFPCPKCGESIPVAANVCRFCQAIITDNDRKVERVEPEYKAVSRIHKDV